MDSGLPKSIELNPNFDEIMGKAWQIEYIQGRKAANSFLLDNGLRAIQEDDGK